MTTNTRHFPGKIHMMPVANQEMGETQVYKRALALGFVSGLRSTYPLAILARTADENANEDGLAGFINSPTFRNVSAVAVVGETIGDKLPFTPARTKGAPFYGRLALGAASGWLLAERFGQSGLRGAGFGVLGAALGSFAGTFYRSVASNLLGTPDFIWGLVEDVVGLSLGSAAVRKDSELFS